ncbi:hypothetical protein ACTFIZ_006065 [Dictyostelium cf. discoideum]
MNCKIDFLTNLINNTTNKEYIKLSIKDFIDKVTITYRVGKRVCEYIFGYSILTNSKELISYIINQYDINKIPDGFNYWNNYPMIEYNLYIIYINDNLKFTNSFNDTFILNYYSKKGYLDKDKNEIYKIK